MNTDETQAVLQSDGPIAQSNRATRRKTRVSPRRAWGAFVVIATIVLASIGGFLQGHANGTMDGFFVALIFLFGGILSISLLFPGMNQELRAFLLAYSVCVFTGGLAQSYSLSVFGQPMSTVDAHTFFRTILKEPPYHSWRDLRTVWTGSTFLGCGAPLAVFIWQYVYHFFQWLGFSFGPYIGTLFNAFIVGLSGSITVRTARELFGNDPWRLRRVGVLFASCGIFGMFGALLLRDSFTLFLNLFVLWGLVRWLRRPSMRNYVIALLLTAFAGLCIWYLRERSTYLFGLFHMLALFCWYWRGKKDLGHLVATLMLPIIIVAASAILLQFFNASLSALTEESGDYVTLSAMGSKVDSLGMALVVNQPAPIRATLGSAVLLAFPIPLWAYIGPGAMEYSLFKTWQGVYKLFLVPLFLAGLGLVLRRVWRKKADVTADAFVALYVVIMLFAVAATSLETRHFGQFMPAMLLLAAIPDTRRRIDRKRVRAMAFLWIGILGAVHIAWAGVRFL